MHSNTSFGDYLHGLRKCIGVADVPQPNNGHDVKAKNDSVRSAMVLPRVIATVLPTVPAHPLDHDDQAVVHFEQSMRLMSKDIGQAIAQKRLVRDVLKVGQGAHEHLADFIFSVNEHSQAAKHETIERLSAGTFRLQLATAAVLSFMAAYSLVRLAPADTDRIIALVDGLLIAPLGVELIDTNRVAFNLREPSTEQLAAFIATHGDRLRQYAAEDAEVIPVAPEAVYGRVAGVVESAFDALPTSAASDDLMALSQDQHSSGPNRLQSVLRSLASLQVKLVASLESLIGSSK